MTVNFLIVGAQKCGTTTLFDVLSRHPALEGSRHKEPHFFSTTDNWRDRLGEYEPLFSEAPGKLRFEASTTYTFFPHHNLAIWDDLHEYNPDLKFLYLVRRPLDRIISAYMHMYERGWIDLSIDEAVLRKPLLIDATRYYTQISPYIERFGRDRVLILDFGEFIGQRRATMDRVGRFLGIDPALFGNVNEIRSNVSAGGYRPHWRFDNPSLPLRLIRSRFPAVWRRITDNSDRHFQERPQLSLESRKAALLMLDAEIDALAGLMDRNLDDWKHPD